MLHVNASLIVLAASLFAAGDSTIEPRALLQTDAHTYATADASVRSALVVSTLGEGERLRSVTELPNGSQLTELATTDGAGRLVRAELTFNEQARDKRVRVVLDPRNGKVELFSPTRRTSWTVPTDLPWVWAPMHDPVSRGAYATPLEAQVALRAAMGNRPVRLLDLTRLESFTLMSDQLLVRDQDSGRATVVLGDDYVEILDGRPHRLHLAAIGGDLETVGTPGTVPVRADSFRAHPAKSITL